MGRKRSITAASQSPLSTTAATGRMLQPAASTLSCAAPPCHSSQASQAHWPWVTAAPRTVFGDSLSLVCLAPLCADGETATLPLGAAFGSDPYDHGAVLEALRLGAFDHAVVRQWAAEGFLAGGTARRQDWEVRKLSEPVPDIVLLASRRLPGQLRLTLGEALVTLGRRSGPTPAAALVAQAALAGLGLDGFGLVLEPDFEALRSRYGSCWPRRAE
mgnify:CR=1 FL=1